MLGLKCDTPNPGMDNTICFHRDPSQKQVREIERWRTVEWHRPPQPHHRGHTAANRAKHVARAPNQRQQEQRPPRITSAMRSFLWSMSSASFSLEPEGGFGLPRSNWNRSSTASFSFTSVLQRESSVRSDDRENIRYGLSVSGDSQGKQQAASLDTVQLHPRRYFYMRGTRLQNLIGYMTVRSLTMIEFLPRPIRCSAYQHISLLPPEKG